jgi:hypothetical protein
MTENLRACLYEPNEQQWVRVPCAQDSPCRYSPARRERDHHPNGTFANAVGSLTSSGPRAWNGSA